MYTANEFSIIISNKFAFYRLIEKGVNWRVIIMSRNDNILNMQITIANSIKEEWKMDYTEVSNLLDKYDLLSYINTCYEEYNSMGIKGILLDLKTYIDSIEGAI